MAINERTAKSLLDQMEFFCDANNPGNVFVKIFYDDHDEVMEVESRLFEAYLSEAYRKAEGLNHSVNLKTVIKPYIDRAILCQRKQKILNLRMAGDKSYLEYYLADENWQRAIINAKGWHLEKKGKYDFIKPSTMKSQACPKQPGGNMDLLNQYINLPPHDLLLFKIHLVQFFLDGSTHMAMVLNASKGTGKTTLSRVIRELVDPSVVEVVATPKNKGDFQNLLVNAKLCILDNTAVFDEGTSNLLAGAITGTTITERKLYSNLDQVVVNLKTALVINGIDIISPKSDLCERSLCYELQKISKANRLTDTEFWESFQENKAVILGGIFDIISKAMKHKQELRLQERHRMADAFEDMAAIALAMGVSINQFETIFQQNIQRLQEQFAESNVVVEAILTYMNANGDDKIDGKAESVYERLRISTYGNSGEFPKSPSALSRYLNNETETLAAAGLTFTKRKKHDYTYMMITKKKKEQKNESRTQKNKTRTAET